MQISDWLTDTPSQQSEIVSTLGGEGWGALEPVSPDQVPDFEPDGQPVDTSNIETSSAAVFGGSFAPSAAAVTPVPTGATTPPPSWALVALAALAGWVILGNARGR